MKNRILLVFLAVVLVVSLVAFAACKAEEEPPVVEEEEPPVVEEEEPPVVEEVWEWPEKLLVATQGAAAADYPISLGWITLLAEDTGMKVRLVVVDMAVRPLWMRLGLVDLSGTVFGTDVHVAAVRDNAARDRGPLQERIVYPYGRGGSGFAVRGDSGIKTPYDIKPGMKFIYLKPYEEWFRRSGNALLAWAQVDPEDVVWVPAGSIPACSTMIMDGKGDVVFGYPASAGWIEAEASPHGLAWIELNAEEDPEGAVRFFEVDASACFGPLTVGGPSALGVWSLVTIPPYVVHYDADPELIYHLVKWFDENYDRFKDAHPYLKEATIENLMNLAEVEFRPLHDGAVKYLEEKGLWTPAHEARQQQNIELLNRYEEAWALCLDMADEKGIKVDPDNEEWIELWENYKKENLPPFRLFTTFP